MYQIAGNEELYIFGVKIFPDMPELTIYSMYVGDERPIYLGHRPILFFRLEDAHKALHASDCGALALSSSLPNEVSFVYDFASVIQELSKGRSKQFLFRHDLISCLNLLEDYFFDTMSQEKRENNTLFTKIFSASFYFFRNDDGEIYFFSDGNRDADKFFSQEGYSRADLADTIASILGRIMVSAKYIGHEQDYLGKLAEG